MNRTAEIIDYLSKPDTPNDIVIAPNAPPIIRIDGKISVALNTVFDALDITDTMAAFKNKALANIKENMSEQSGSFSFGIRSVGRFRINYVTQRGTVIMVVIIIPCTIPAIDQLCEDPAIVAKATAVISTDKPGLITVCGPNATKNSIFTYSMLQYINQNKRSIIYAIENILTFLMSHENSIIIQCEVGTDIDSMTEGIYNASLFNPDIMYVGDIKPSDNFPEITNAIENGTLVIVSSVLLSGKDITEKYYPKTIYANSAPDMTSGIFMVAPSKNSKLSVTYNKAFSGIYAST